MIFFIFYFLSIFSASDKLTLEKDSLTKIKSWISDLKVTKEESLKQKRNPMNEPDSRLISKIISMTNDLCELKKHLFSSYVKYSSEIHSSFSIAFDLINEIYTNLNQDFNQYYVTKINENKTKSNDLQAKNELERLDFDIKMLILHLENYVKEIDNLLEKYKFILAGFLNLNTFKEHLRTQTNKLKTLKQEQFIDTKVNK